MRGGGYALALTSTLSSNVPYSLIITGDGDFEINFRDSNSIL